jgi:carboxypeptidase T
MRLALPRVRAARALSPLLAIALVLAAASTAAASEFPAGKQGYHSYTEMAADVAAVAAAHPDIVSRFSIGKSYQGRDLWAVKISDNVNVDEAEPEVMFDGGHHADEHMSTEMTLHILHWLVDGYGVDPRITAIVDSREIWIVFMVNPDGVEYDISGGRFHNWRKNRQPTPGTSSIGTDLNRNYGYRWGGGGRTSANPADITYRGTAAFSTPEDRAMRAFLASRVVGGRQQIRTAITFHESGRLVMWPYGYTMTDVPSDMTYQDHAALALMGRNMARTNGYKPEQASDLYISSGTSRDYQYGVYRIFTYTFEMSVVAYPDDSLIEAETGRNKEAALYVMERAACPLGVLGLAVRITRCGAFDDDLEVNSGWTVNPDGTDTAPASGRFVRANPASTSSNGPKQLGTTTSGSMGFVTGAPAGSSSTANDLDGRTSIHSPAIDLPATPGQHLTFRYVFAHSAASTTSDGLRAFVELSDGTRVQVFRVVGAPVDVDGTWRSASLSMDAFAGQTVRLRFEAVDGGPGNLVEVELDDIRVTRPG